MQRPPGWPDTRLVVTSSHSRETQRVRSHPFDLATERRISVQELAVQIPYVWNDIGLVVPGTRQAGDVVACQHRPAFLDCHLL